MKRPVLL